ncbi:MAG: hypothetical protein BWX84_01966 [Verrucomicrobia bacterium ADurb.Bin118]|nr:MAG: hypothetical protein BWX84_01966 [Verrucomicrobia bacterium ADurb.Bin118]
MFKFVFRQQDRRVPQFQQERPFRAEEQGRFRWIILHRVQGANAFRRIEITVKPFHRERFVRSQCVAGKRPSNVLSLRPGIRPARGRVLPRRLHFRHHLPGRLQIQSFPDGIEQMATDVARPAGAKVLPGTPSSRMIKLAGIRTDRGGAQPPIPLELWRRRTARVRTRSRQTIILHGTGTVGAQINLFDPAHRAFAQHLHGAAFARARGHLGAQLRDHLAFPGRPGERPHLRDVVTHRFLAINMFAEFDGPIRNREVHVIRHGYTHGIHAFRLRLQQLPPVGVAARVRKRLGRPVECEAIHVTHRRDPHPRVARQRV